MPVPQLANAAGPSRAAPPPAAAQKVDLSKLPATGAIVWGKPSGAPVTIFTDLHCGFCRALANELEQMNVRVIERSEEHTSELQSLMRISYAVFCLQKKTTNK